MNETRLTTIAQLKDFLDGCAGVQFGPSGQDSERYTQISRVLKRFDYLRLGKGDKGVVLLYLARTSGYSRQQLTRLVARWRTIARQLRLWPSAIVRPKSPFPANTPAPT